MRIRKISFSEELASLVRRLFPASEPLFRKNDSYFIAEEGGRIIGFSHLVEADGRILLQGIGVLSEWRERGIGGRLLDAALRFADKKGMDVFLKVKPDNPALGLYYKKGFTLKKIKDVYVLERKRVN